VFNLGFWLILRFDYAAVGIFVPPISVYNFTPVLIGTMLVFLVEGVILIYIINPLYIYTLYSITAYPPLHGGHDDTLEAGGLCVCQNSKFVC